MIRATLISFAVFVALHADTLTIRNGATVTGTWAGADADHVMFVGNGETRSYPRCDVSRVTFGAAPAPAVTVEPMPTAPPAPSTSTAPPGAAAADSATRTAATN